MITDPARFDRVTAHPGYAATAERRIELPYGSITAIAGPSAIAMFGMLFLMIAIGLLIESEAPLWFAIPFVGGALMFVGGAIAIAARELRFHHTPIVRLVGVVAKERTRVSSGGDGSRTTTTYYTTLQLRDGARVEYETPGRLAGRLAVDDIGVAYVKAHLLVDFTRFDV